VASPYLSEIRIFSFNFAPRGWALCNGQVLPINQNQALFSLLGTNFGGNGVTVFNLPDLRSRSPIHFGAGFVLGQAGGEEFHTLTALELPGHNHLVGAVAQPGNAASPAGANFAAHRGGYAESGSMPLAAGTVGNTGANQAHANLQPYTVLSFCIALQGIFPSPN